MPKTDMMIQIVKRKILTSINLYQNYHSFINFKPV